jgi:mannose-6-phosphate isomerase-like protein (cupin superfamily)
MRTPAFAAALLSLSLFAGALVIAQQPPAPAAGRAGRAAAAPTPAAPPAGSPAIYKSDAELSAALKQATERAAAGAQISAAFANTDQYRINVVKRTQGATPLAHAGNTELHHIIEGSATVVTGGKIVRGANGTSSTIEGGVSRHVTKGDVILVPADTPHWYKDVEGSVTYLEVRFVVPTK